MSDEKEFPGDSLGTPPTQPDSGEGVDTPAAEEAAPIDENAAIEEASVTSQMAADASADDVMSETATEDVSTESAASDTEAVAEEKPAPPPPPPPPPPPKASLPAVDEPDEIAPMDWYILKVAFNREDSIAEALQKRVKMEGLEDDIREIIVPTEDIVKFTREGKRRIAKQKLYPGYIMVHMRINDDTWFLVRETSGISDFTGAAGKPMPMDPADVERIINKPEEVDEDEEPQIKIGIPFKVGDRVRVKEGNFENQEGDVDAVDETNGNITVIINIFGRSVPMELKHFQVEPL